MAISEAATNPFQLLSNIASRSREQASDLPSQVEAVAFWRGVGFRLAGCTYVAPMEEVSEILTSPKFTKVPGAKHWVNGVANVRGRLMPIMDLCGFFGQRQAGSFRQRRVLVVEHGDLLNGLTVDAVLGMQQFAEDTYDDQLQVEVADFIRPFVMGRYQKEGVEWPVISLHALVNSSEFMQIAV